jgi:hypothetical protein
MLIEATIEATLNKMAYDGLPFEKFSTELLSPFEKNARSAEVLLLSSAFGKNERELRR